MDTAMDTALDTDARQPLALVAGASRGLGLLIAREFGRRGHRVVITARDTGELAAAKTELQSRGVREVEPRACDSSDADALAALVEEVERDFGPIEAAVHVAGIIQVGPMESMTREHFREAIDVMLWGPINLAFAVVPGMRERGQGRFGVVTSIGGMVAVPHLWPYTTAKFGAVGFAQGLAAELAGSGVTATTIVPGLMRTGGHVHAQFTGKQEAEYAWFAAGASAPLVAMNAERAAGRIVAAVLRGDAMVVLTPLAKLGIRVNGVAPALTNRVMGLVGRLLPGPGGDGSTIEGAQARARLDSPLLNTVTVLGDRAAARFNELRGR